uniref:AA_permease domain-containing protein n=1 Tax=Panagrellus redivivus TaxID=6233 RepID=A0A7E4VZW0_PANRE
MLDSVFERFSYRKILNGEQLLHSEWNRRLGVFSLAGIGGITALCTLLFIILPHVLATGSEAPPIPPVCLAMFMHFLIAKQLSAIARILPRNCLLYELAYASHSEFLAFILGWSQLVDGIAFMALTGHALSDHLRLLFDSVYKEHVWSITTISTMEVDPITIGALVFAGILMCCSLRVLATVVVVFLISSLFTVTSTTVVAVLHNLNALRINPTSNPYKFLEMAHEMHWLILSVLSIEVYSHVSEETEQPRKTLPLTFTTLSKVSTVLILIAAMAYFPFTQRVKFHEGLLLPSVFSSIGVYSARYLLSVGATCALAGGVLVTVLPVSRIMCAMSRDRLLPFATVNVSKLQGKGGSPRCAVIISSLLGAAATLLPRVWIYWLLPISICTRILGQSLLVFQFCFSPDAVGLTKTATKYNRLRASRSPTTHDNHLSVADDGYSAITSDEEDEDEVDNEIITHLCEVTTRQNNDWSSVLDAAAETGYQNYQTEAHNCFQSSCGDQQLNRVDIEESRPNCHIYETEFQNSPFHCHSYDGQAPEPFACPEKGQRKAIRYLTYYICGCMLIAVAYKTLRESTHFIPIMAVIVIIGSAIALFILLILTHRLRSFGEEHLIHMPTNLPIISMLLIFFSTQLLFTFNLIQFAFLVIMILVGTFMYLISVCQKV